MSFGVHEFKRSPQKPNSLVVIRLILMMLVGLGAYAFAEPKGETPFPERVSALLSSAWTELTITTALFTDYGGAYATSVRLERNTTTASVHFSLPLGPKTPSKTAVTEIDIQDLYSALRAAAKATFEHRYPVKIINSVSREKALEMVESGKLKMGPYDVEVLDIRAKSAAGEVNLQEYGPFSPLDTTIQKLFHTEQIELNEKGRNAAFGSDTLAEP